VASSLKLLAWDTQFFGFRVAAYHAAQHYADELQKQLQAARDAGIVLFTYFAPAGTQITPSIKHSLVDTRHIYMHDLNGDVLDGLRDPPDTIEVYHSKTTTPELEALGVLSGTHSRFFYDPIFPDKAAEAMYISWTRQCCANQSEFLILIAKDESGEIAGWLATRDKRDLGVFQPMLMAVNPSIRGQGIATGFFTYVMNWGQEKGFKMGRVNTQGRNKVACRIYERLGWTLESRKDVFHIWLADPTEKVEYA